GAGPAGLAAATTAASRGHEVVLFEAAEEIGGQFNLAKQIPGKEEFAQTLRYFANALADTGVNARLGTRVGVDELVAGQYDTVILATGVTPRIPDIPGVDHPSVVTYLQVLRDHVPVGRRVAILGAGGIGFDVAEYLTQSGPSSAEDAQQFNAEWGIDPTYANPGGLTTPHQQTPARQVQLLQRKTTKIGAGLGKTTGWIHRATLAQREVVFARGASYDRIDDAGLHITLDGEPHVLEVDTIVLCTGQEPSRDLLAGLHDAGVDVRVIGGADVATELDAKRAIKAGTELAAGL
ncbi:MAG: FAD/NAD(P)-binding oxidoreductase, partial [Actinomycetes bacterium]